MHYPSGHPAWELPSALSRGARTFLDARARRAPRSPGGLARFTLARFAPIKRLVGHGVSSLVEVPTDMGWLERFELVDQSFELLEEWFELLVLDSVAALKLSHDEFGIQAQLKVGCAHFERCFDGCDGALVLGDVVGGSSDGIAPGVKLLAGGGAEDCPVSGWTGIASRRAVGVGDEVHVGELSAASASVVGALRRGSLAASATDVCARSSEIPAASAGMTKL